MLSYDYKYFQPVVYISYGKFYKETGTKDFSHQKRKVNLPVYFYQFRIVSQKDYRFRAVSQNIAVLLHNL